MTATETAAPFTLSFKPALLGSSVTWKIDGTKLSKNGRVVADLASVTSGHWHQTAHRGTQMRTLKLRSDAGTAVISANSSAGQHDFRDFYRVALTTLAHTAVHSPKARINMGGGLANMIMMFVLGTMVFALGVFCMVMAIGEAPFFIGLLAIPFLGLGGLLMVAMRPWNHHRLSIPVAAALSSIMNP